ncbi:MAG: aminoglycoside phosphotransferase family protein [Deltaproteobacteria bacterium]|nr:aminoglycoside phosphotransferase family protein [Deltaproteobacteria bacterium]
MQAALAAAARFGHPGQVVAVREYGHGNVNDTFLATLAGREARHFIVQRLNTHVFPQPALVMHNLRVFTEHARQRLSQVRVDPTRRWETPQALPDQDGQDHWIDSQGSFWRALSFIDHAHALDAIQNNRHAEEVGLALGMFHLLASDLPPARLADTLPGFHVTPVYLRAFDRVLAQRPPKPSPEVKYALNFISHRRAWATILEQARQEGRLTLRPIHGDPKVNNVMLDTDTGRAVGLIDLDTVKPGLIQYDLGDCLRSGCNPLGEETQDWQAVQFDPDLCQAILRGYLAWARNFLTPDDYLYLYDAIRLIAFELGLRFVTDYLAGNAYFKARHPEHNLWRALVQFQLTASIESQAGTIQTIIRDFK